MFAKLIERCEAIVTDVEFRSVRQWKESNPGKKVVGYFPVYAPAEIIHASGALPVALHGAGDQLDLQHADARFGSFICSITKSTLELGMTKRLEAFDGLLFSSICDTARNLCFVMKRNFPDQYVDFLHLPHNSESPATIDFLSGEYERLRNEIGELTGHRATDEELANSIALFNQNRALTNLLYDFRSGAPHLLTTYELYLVVRAGNFLPVEEHNELMRSALDSVATRSAKQRDSIRVVIEGSFCEQPPLDLIRILESAGCYVVDDDFAVGRRWFSEPVPSWDPPIESLASSYVTRSVYSSVRHDSKQSRVDGLLGKIQAAKADAVISLIAKFCEPAYFDYVLFKQELEKRGIAHLPLEFEEKMFTFDRLQMEIETFVESLLFV